MNHGAAVDSKSASYGSRPIMDKQFDSSGVTFQYREADSYTPIPGEMFRGDGRIWVVEEVTDYQICVETEGDRKCFTHAYFGRLPWERVSAKQLLSAAWISVGDRYQGPEGEIITIKDFTRERTTYTVRETPSSDAVDQTAATNWVRFQIDTKTWVRTGSLKKQADFMTGDIVGAEWDGHEIVGIVVGRNDANDSLLLLSGSHVHETPFRAQYTRVLERQQVERVGNYPFVMASLQKTAAVDLFNISIIEQGVNMMAGAILSMGDPKLTLIWGAVRMWIDARKKELQKTQESKLFEDFDYQGGTPVAFPYMG